MLEYKPLQEKAYIYIKNLIISGQLVAGIIYSETKLSVELGISRTPLKDALVRLSQEKYIDIIPSRGFCLHTMSREDVSSTYQLRVALEGFCSMNLSKQAASKENYIKALESNIMAMEKESHCNHDLQVFTELDFQFHSMLVASLENKDIDELFETYHRRISCLAFDCMLEQDETVYTCEEHWNILNAIRDSSDKNGFNAYLAVEKHMDRLKEITITKIPK